MRFSILAVLVIVASTAVLAPPAEASAGKNQDPKVYEVGDSYTVGKLMVGLPGYLQGWSVTAHGLTGRAINAGPQPTGWPQLRRDKRYVKHASAVVIQLGTNPQDGTHFVGALSRMVRWIHRKNPGAQVFWVNIYHRQHYQGQLDLRKQFHKRDRAVAARAPSLGLHIINWAKEASAHREWFHPGNLLHPDANGFKELCALENNALDG
jgi:hypothetical protein